MSSLEILQLAGAAAIVLVGLSLTWALVYLALILKQGYDVLRELRAALSTTIAFFNHLKEMLANGLELLKIIAAPRPSGKDRRPAAKQ